MQEKENIYKAYQPPSSGGGVYLKFEDGVPVRIRLMSDPVVFDSEFQGNLSTRYAWLAWNFDEECAQVMVLPVTAYRMVAEIGGDEDWGDPLENPYNLKVVRRGKGTETKYNVTPSMAKEALPNEAITEVKGLNLTSLVEASPSASRVQWLRDVVKTGRTTEDAPRKRDVVIEDIGDEPINLDDIPF